MTDKMMNAEKFWNAAEERVTTVMFANNLDAAVDCAEENGDFCMQDFLFDLFDYGDYEPTDEEIVAALTEALEELN